MANINITPTRKRILEQVSQGRIQYASPMGWFQKGGFSLRKQSFPGERNPADNQMQVLQKHGYIKVWPANGPGSWQQVTLTAKGAEVIESAD